MDSSSGRTLLVSDLDGTLLRPDGTLSETTARVINAYIANGGLFTYATARSFTTASRVTAPLNLSLPVITYGGAIIVDPRTGESRPARTLAAEAVAEVLAEARDSVQPIVFAMHEGRDRVFWRADRMTAGVDDFLRTRQGDPRLLPLESWSILDPASVFYISLIGDREAVDELRARLVEVALRCNVVHMEDIYAPGQWWLELTSPAGTKAVAVTALKRELAADTLICFGDNHNDLLMLAAADISLAVANATPAVRAAATNVIGANSADGVAWWISQLP